MMDWVNVLNYSLPHSSSRLIKDLVEGRGVGGGMAGNLPSRTSGLAKGSGLRSDLAKEMCFEQSSQSFGQPSCSFPLP